MNRDRWFDQRRKVTLWSDEHSFGWRTWFICEDQWNRSYACEASENENENESMISEFDYFESLSSIDACEITWYDVLMKENLILVAFVYVRKLS